MAIWGDWIRARFAGPKLILSLREGAFVTPRVDRSSGTKWNALYYHLEVSNERTWSPANGVRVLVIGITRRAPDGSYIADPIIADFQLTWAYPEFHELFPTIAAGRERCDLGFLDGPQANQFKLSTYIQPATLRGYVDRNDSVRVTIVASAHNGRSKPIVVEISWDGTWRDSEMDRHLMVNDISTQQ